ncbi:MAG: MdtA/MuxA family multidrug efflux RND transporter periplasmic adaptor subunit [Acidobacteriaceae bacterium]|nr:MdtA/MuxA family multidrug efflux RND transporter periplasmic adaptor subunit [Acidobacteriaceae bacterium]
MGTKPPALEPHTKDANAPETPLKSPFPDIRLGEGPATKSRWWVWLLVFAAIAYGCYLLYNFENGKKTVSTGARAAARPRSTPVVAATAQRGNMPVYLEGLGTVTAFNTVTVKPRVDGQLTNVAFREGQFVNKGDLLAEIDPRPFQVALEQARGNLAQAQGNLAKDEAALRDAQVNYERDQQLYKDQIIAKQQLDSQLAVEGEARGSIQADQATIAAAQAAIGNAQLNLSYTKIVSPISGRIGLRLVDVGNMVHASDPNGLAVITQLQPIAVMFTIPEDQLPPVLRRLRQGAKMRVEAYDRDQKKKLAEGTLLTVDNQIDPTTGTSRLKAVFPNTDYALFPNQFVNARLWLDTRKDVTIVPAVAVQRGPTGTFVYVVQDDSTVSVRPVRLGMTQGNDVSIDDGIQPGERVVVDGAEKLTDGVKVSVSGAGGASGRRGQQ